MEGFLQNQVDCLLQAAASYTGAAVKEFLVHEFDKGASGRSLIRLTHSMHDPLIGIAWTLARADNHSFVPVARCLKEQGVLVPEVYAYEEIKDSCGEVKGGWALVQDLGDKDLLSMKDESWSWRRPYYKKALENLARIDSVSHESIVWQPPFDAALYRWEQEYFAEHFLGHYCGCGNYHAFLAEPKLQALSESLAALPRTLLHRDFHSENIIIFNDETYFIDFQGMRLGRREYDLASLIYDPYAKLTVDEQDELLEFWKNELHSGCFSREIFDQCALQRLMQALGAYANIGLNRGNKWYLEQIPQALTNFSRVIQRTELADLPWFKVHCRPH